MFSFFKRLSRKDEPQRESPAKVSPCQQAEPDALANDHDQETKELTPASWPPKEKKPYPIMWGGGCCG